jgi:excinuclease ABC subunit A
MHPQELDGLVGCLEELRDAGNTVVVVEHDFAVVRRADYVIDMGPGAGAAGGKVVAAGTPEDIAGTRTETGKRLSGDQVFSTPRARRTWKSKLEVTGARENNLKEMDVAIPLGVLVGVCGVSGSGKSSLVIDTIARALAPKKQTASVSREPIEPGAHNEIRGAPPRVVLVDQSAAGLHSPASFLSVDAQLRRVYAASPEREALSLSVEDVFRRCDVCGGGGGQDLDMGFLPSVWIPCEVCGGSGFATETRTLKVAGVSLPEVYALTLTEVAERFAAYGELVDALTPALRVGLGYLVLGQRGASLSGGEAQRLKLARQLGKRRKETTLYVLDEPTVGQHMSDVAVLTHVLHQLVEDGATVIAVEHHPHLLASCDWLLELGPGGGEAGGTLIASGTPEDLAAGSTPTAPYLRGVLEGRG